MTEEKKKLEIVFAPGCFDAFDGTQEELDNMVAEIKRMVESGEFLEKSQPVDFDEILEDLTDEEIENLFSEVETNTKRTLQ